MYTDDIKTKKVSDLMSRNILTGHVSNSFTHTLRLFSEMTFHHLPILNSEQELVGIISSTDLLKLLTLKLPLLKNTDEESINMELDMLDAMTSSPITITQDASIEEALAIFAKHHIHALPVMGKSGLVGIITSNDILAFL